MLKVEKFLGVFEIETGGVVIGVLCLIGNILSLFTAILGIAFVSIHGCQTFHQVGGLYTETAIQIEKMCTVNQAFMLVQLIVAAVINLGFAAIAFLCIRGTKRRDHIWVRPQMIVCLIVSAAFFFSILSFNSQVMLTGLVFGLINGYCFVVLYSLYEIFKSERESSLNVEVAVGYPLSQTKP